MESLLLLEIVVKKLPFYWLLCAPCLPLLSSACAHEVPAAEQSADAGVEEVAAESSSSELGMVSDALSCPKVSGTMLRRSLAVGDPEILAKFGFGRTINQLLATAKVASTETNVGVFQRWMRTFGATDARGDCNDDGIDPENFGLACPRADELRLSTINPFAGPSAPVQFAPVAVMNRFDLMPGNGSNCGEYRIVYAMNSSAANISGRAFIIFEAALPNPNPAQGREACLPVARFWQGLTADNNTTSRAAKLEKFYFTGGAVPGFAPVVRAAHYGFGEPGVPVRTAGQIRTNFFVNNREWHLREYKLRRSCTDVNNVSTCKLGFDHVTVKQNPAEELFGGKHTRSAEFLPNFLDQVPRLAAADVNSISMRIDNDFNEFESVAQASNVQYSLPGVASSATRQAIQQKLTSIGSKLSVNNILDRATTQTCAGCHELSNGADLGGGLTWPSSASFVHVDEQRQLSPALLNVFLPRRKNILEAFINSACDGVTAADAKLEGAVN